MKKILVTTLVMAAIVLALVWAANSFDLMGALRRMHGH
jgi:hypothetical protein